MSFHDYTGHVEPGAPAITRTADTGDTTVEIRKVSVGPMDNNAYLLTDLADGEALLIDAANEADRLLDEIGDRHLVAILTTHGHQDHWQALAEVANATGAATYLHPADQGMVPHKADHECGDGERISFGGAAVTLLHTPGHTPGSTCARLDATTGEGTDRVRAHLFTGDTLFPGGPGNTFGDAAAFEQIMHSLREQIFTHGDETWVYPGHGDDTTIGAERASLDDWQARGW